MRCKHWLTLAVAVLSIQSSPKAVSAAVEIDSRAWFEHPTPGIIRPDEGTIEVVATISKPFDQVGNSYDFAVQMLPAQPVSGSTILGLFFSTRNHQPYGLNFITRSGESTATASAAQPQYKMGEPVVIACTWGRESRLYLNGQLVATAPFNKPIAPMPATFRMLRSDPFNLSAAKVSDVQLPAERLTKDPRRPFERDADTTLIVTDRLSKAETFQTSYHRKSAVAVVRPKWTMIDQVFVEGETPAFTVAGVNHGASPKSYAVRFDVTDTDGKKVAEREQTLSLSPGGKIDQVELALPELKACGFYKLNTTVRIDGEEPTVYPSSLAVLPSADADVANGKLATYLGHHQDHEPEMLQRMGIRTARSWAAMTPDVFGWHAVEPVKGKFTWSRTDELVRRAKAANVELLGVLSNPPAWAAIEPSEAAKKSAGYFGLIPARWNVRDVAEWENYVFQTVSRYKGVVKAWEIYNEVDFHPPGFAASFQGSTQDYFNLLKSAYKQIKRADPKAKVSMAGFALLSVCDTKMPYDLLKMGAADFFDVFAMHAYEGTRHIDRLNEAVDAVKPSAERWMTEQMWDQVKDDHRRSFLTPALYAWFLEKGYSRFYQFAGTDLGWNRATLSPNVDTQVTGAFQAMIRKCDAFTGVLRFENAEAMSVRHAFKRTDGTHLTMLGSELGRYTAAVKNPDVRAFDVYGRKVAVKSTTDGGSVVPVDSVTYVLSREPLLVTRINAESNRPLYVNGSFEEVIGDAGTGGLASLSPRNWTFRPDRFDPDGKIGVTDQANTGSYAISVRASGKGAVYLFQDIDVPLPGTYRVTAKFKRVSGDVRPYIAVYKRDLNQVDKMLATKLGADGYQTVSANFEFDAKPTVPVGVMVGVEAGQGELLIDDVSIEAVQESRVSADRVWHGDLTARANMTLDQACAVADVELPPAELVKLQGQQLFDGVPFALPKSLDKAASVVAGKKDGATIAADVSGIPVGQKLNRLFFLQTGQYVLAKPGEQAAGYRVNYADGTNVEVPVRVGEGFYDWYCPTLPASAKPAVKLNDPRRFEVGWFVMPWTNPQPENLVRSVDVLAGQRAVIVLTGLTGELHR